MLKILHYFGNRLNGQISLAVNKSIWFVQNILVLTHDAPGYIILMAHNWLKKKQIPYMSLP